jgi:large subunit ribosomal protein L29
MIMAKAKELREMSSDQLEFSLRESRENLFKLKFRASTEKLDAPSSLRKARREIARLQTILRERQPKTAEKRTAEKPSGGG